MADQEQKNASDASFEEAVAEESENESDNISRPRDSGVLNDPPYPSSFFERKINPELPKTVTILENKDGAKVYIVGTAHFSMESQEDVAKTIQATQPDIVVLELCGSRTNLLSLDEETLMSEIKNIGIEKLRTAIKQSGVVQGLLHILLLTMSAHLTEQLGMAPGGEFRRALAEAKQIRGCRVLLGDRPIQVTLKRVLGALSAWQSIRLFWHVLTMKDPVSKEDVEKCKESDMLEAMLKEMSGEFPALSLVFLDERDMYLSHQLFLATRQIPNSRSNTGYSNPVVVGVVGMGHVRGIVDNWMQPIDMKSLMIVPKKSLALVGLQWTLRVSVIGIVAAGSYGIFRLIRKVVC